MVIYYSQPCSDFIYLLNYILQKAFVLFMSVQLQILLFISGALYLYLNGNKKCINKWEFNPFICAEIFQKMLDNLSFREPELVPCSSSWSQAETSCNSSSMRSFLHLAQHKLNPFSIFLCFSQFGFCVILRGTCSKVSMLCWSCERWPGSHAVLSFCTLLKSNMKFFVLF